MSTQQQQPLSTSASDNALDLKNIQGDILVGGFPKKTETYLFFQITKPGPFKKDLAELLPLIKSAAQVVKDRERIEKHKKECREHGRKPDLLPLVGVNVSFSRFGLDKLGITAADVEALDDPFFANGQLRDSASLGDKGEGEGDGFVPDWDPAFKEKIDGVIFVAGDSHATVDKKLSEVKHIFGVRTSKVSIREVKYIRGDVRPEDQNGHEHFGFLDGISNPSIIGVDKDPLPVPKPVRAGSIIVGREGDSRTTNRPLWALDGSFLAFRYLFQLVPEFDKFLEEHPIVKPGLSPEEGSELLGARLVGRWKSGTPIELSPFKDDPEIAKDPKRINNFRFEGQRDSQELCPFAAHIRKTLPRADLEDNLDPSALENRRIMRRGIPFGPEVTEHEKSNKKTEHGRGLLFVCYQSSIVDAFHFIQQSWANDRKFPFTEQAPEEPGFDAIIGQAGGGKPRVLSGTNPHEAGEEITLKQEFVVPRGGEYFFTPSIKALKENFIA